MKIQVDESGRIIREPHKYTVTFYGARETDDEIEMEFIEALEIGVTIDHPNRSGTYEITGKHFSRKYGKITLNAESC